MPVDSIKNKNMNYSDYYNSGNVSDGIYSDFLGMCFGSKRCQDKRAVRQEAKKSQKELEVAQNKADIKDANDYTTGAKSTGGGDTLKALLGGLGGLFGQQAQQAPTTTDNGGLPPEEEKSKMGLYIGIAVAVIVIGVGIYFLTKKK